MKKIFICLFMSMAYAHETPKLSIDGDWKLQLPYLEIETINGKKAYSTTLISKDGGTTFIIVPDSIEEVVVYAERVLSKKVEEIWNKAEIIPNENAGIVRKDECGARIKKFEYGCRQCQYGWELDHIYPEAKGGSNDLSNLQPLHWRNNVSKSNHWPEWECKIILN